MRRGQLADYFSGVGVKRLSVVDAEPKRSNQHEIGTTREMRAQFLGDERHRVFPVVYIWLGEDQEGFTARGSATHYDTRENKPKRSAEWRLYYPSNPVTDAMKAGDTLFLAKDKNDHLYFIVTPENSTSEQQLLWLFGVVPKGGKFVSREVSANEPRLDFAARFVLDEIGIEFDEPEAEQLDTLVERFGMRFPPTAELSQLARDSLPGVRVEEDADAALIAWLAHEEALFRRLERRVVSARLEQGFMEEEGGDVDGFISFSLSVQNRRKSRMGYSLENHLEAVFCAYRICYVRGATTEYGHKPDFLFPDVETYASASVDGDARLAMLGSKSTCKDRWRQVLSEAAKIPRKHLLTLEPGISSAQTDQMEASNLQLVVPRPIQGSYSETQKNWLWSLGDFITDVARRQA